MACVIGVDVGGTNTDAVILQGRKILSSCKQETSVDCTQGIVNSIKGCLENITEQQQLEIKKGLQRVCIGTTHFVNAVVQRSTDKLTPVAVIRLCGPASIGVPPFADFPPDLSKIIKKDIMLLSGGLQYNGEQILPVLKDELESAAKQLLSHDPPVLNIVISSIFSPLDNPDTNQEVQAANIMKQVSPRFSFTLSSQIGKLGLIERENAAILNESLKPYAMETIQSFKAALMELQLTCPFHLTQNDGTLISIDEAVHFPILTFSSGPTNSMRGAMFLTGKKDAIVVDIGGTTTDVGMLVNGFPREASSQVKIGGVRTNFQMPDVPSIGLGGGSIITKNEKLHVGPESVGYNLTSKALCFGGDTCTATDVAIASGIVTGNLGNSTVHIDPSTTYKAMKKIKEMLESAIDMVKIDKNDVPVLLVGGGSILVDLTSPLKGVSSMVIPQHYAVANAIGAALGMVSGRSDRIESITKIISTIEDQKEKSEEDLFAMARTIAIEKGITVATNAARAKGSYPGTEVIHEKSVVDVSYVPNALRVTIKVVGSLNKEPLDMIAPSTNNSSVLPTATALDAATIRDNPLWPYSSEEDMKRDDSIGLSKPLVDKESGVWTLTESDVECISIGAGILGCGGGGDPNIGRVIALQQIKQGKKIQIVNPCRINHDRFGLVVSVAFMGAPVVLNEKLINGTESLNCIKAMQKLLASGICESSCDYGRKETGNIALTLRKLDNGNDVWIAGNLPEGPMDSKDIPLHQRLTGLMCAEVGGFNSFEPLVTGARVNLPVLDADGMGRAFPELQMFLPFINGLPAYPSCVADENGEVIAVTHVSNSNTLETFLRMECIRMGMECGAAICPMTLNQVLSTCVLFSYSQAWQLGRAVTSASLHKTSVVQAITEQQHGLLLISGKVLDVDRSTAGGFSGSKVTVQGTGDHSGYTIQVIAKNENYIAQLLNQDKSLGEILAVTPDLITIIDTDTGYPITTEDMRYGLRVSVLVLPANDQLLSPQALSVVGPSGFGFTDIKYQKPRSVTEIIS